MKRRLDSIIIGGAMLFGGIAHRRADTVSRQVEELGEAVEAVGEQLREVDARAASRPPVPGMPLPTGYGLQVRGPDDESIVLPVCLPPGFELASMVLCPEFLPRDKPQPATARKAPIAPAPEPARAAEPAPPLAERALLTSASARERFGGTLQYVFGSEPGYSVDESFGGAVEAEPARPPRTRGIETHHL